MMREKFVPSAETNLMDGILGVWASVCRYTCLCLQNVSAYVSNMSVMECVVHFTRVKWRLHHVSAPRRYCFATAIILGKL